MPSIKVRFDVFKRDKFQCQYCGSTPPQVVLELDHIMPKAKNGRETVDNYITACFDCNRGKRDGLLTDVPRPIENKLAELKEKRLQLKLYNEFLEEQDAELTKELDKLDSHFSNRYKGYIFSDSFRNTTLKRFLAQLPSCKLHQALDIGFSRFPDDRRNALKYFCGVCWNWIKEPQTRDW